MSKDWFDTARENLREHPPEPPIDWQSRCETAEALSRKNHDAALGFQNRALRAERRADELFDRSEGRLNRIGLQQNQIEALQAELAAIKGRRLPLPVLQAIVRAVAELQDRSSPEDWPEAMLVTEDELGSIVRKLVDEWLAGPWEPSEPKVEGKTNEQYLAWRRRASARLAPESGVKIGHIGI